MRDYKNLIGQRFGLLVVKEVLEREVDSGGYLKPARAMCKCDCGTLKSVKCNDLLSGKSLSCGCQKGNLHGEQKAQYFFDLIHGDTSRIVSFVFR